jgi:hypothetical protein
MLHSAWSPTTDNCSLASAPATAKFKVTVDRTVNLLELTKMNLADAGHGFAFPNGNVQVKVSYGANISKAIRSSDSGKTWSVVPQQAPPFAQRSSRYVSLSLSLSALYVCPQLSEDLKRVRAELSFHQLGRRALLLWIRRPRSRQAALDQTSLDERECRYVLR